MECGVMTLGGPDHIAWQRTGSCKMEIDIEKQDTEAVH